MKSIHGRHPHCCHPVAPTGPSGSGAETGCVFREQSLLPGSEFLQRRFMDDLETFLHPQAGHPTRREDLPDGSGDGMTAIGTDCDIVLFNPGVDAGTGIGCLLDQSGSRGEG